MFKEKTNKTFLFLGPKGSYTDAAKDCFIEKYGFKNCEEIPQYSITSALAVLGTNENKNIFAVLPIENSIEGIVRETIDNLTKTEDKSVKILSELVLPISHCLITKAKSVDNIKCIASYPQGIAQCRDFIQKNFPNGIKIKTTDSTSEAVRKLQKKDNTHAAIASEKASQLYNIPILKKEINDVKDNKTRFLLIGREDTPRTGMDKTSITFSTENKPGALNKILNILDKYEINMSYIDSRPSKKNLGEYSFYIDFDGHIKDEKIAKAIFEILQHTKFFKHLGSYAKFN